MEFAWKKVLLEVSCVFPTHAILSHNDRSVVCVASDIQHQNREVVLKAYSQSQVGERKCLSSVQHPNLVVLLSSFQVQEFQVLVFEKVIGEPLINVLSKLKKMSEIEASKISSQVALGLSHLHSSGWVHLDVKPDNMIYHQPTGQVKLVDFEFTSKFSKCKWIKHRKSTGTLLYSSPELRRGWIYGPEVDAWSLGVSIYAMVTGRFPFNESELEERTESLRLPQNLSPECRHLLAALLNSKASRRMRPAQLNSHPWITRDPSSHSVLVLSKPK